MNYSIQNQPKPMFKILIVGLIVLVGLVLGGLYMLHRTYQDNLLPVSSSQEVKQITIKRGTTPHEIAVLLEKEGIVKSSWSFEWYVRNNGARDVLKAGTYELHPALGVPAVVNILTEGKVSTDLITILPGSRLSQIKQYLVDAGYEKAAVDQALVANNYTDHPALVDMPSGANLEGYIYPETFQRTADTTPEIIIESALDELQKRLTPELRAAIVKQGFTVHEGIILASVIEKEGRTTQERAQIAQVFIKRLEEGIELGADATVRYAIDKPTGPLTSDELDTDSPYNTRKFTGLPPGPISNVTLSSLEAVAYPEDGDYLFFVTGNDGVTRFSKTIGEHEALIQKHGVRGEE